MNLDRIWHLLNAAVIPVVMTCWILFAVPFLLRRRLSYPSVQKQDNLSLLGLVMVGIGFYIVWSQRRPVSESIVDAGAAAGIVVALLTMILAAASVVLVISAVWTLGKQWSLAARIVKDHTLITNGPYALVRNPIYTGVLGLMMATGLGLSTGIALAGGIVLGSAGTLLRIHREEKLLRETFGATFDAYARRVPSLLPLWRPRGRYPRDPESTRRDEQTPS